MKKYMAIAGLVLVTVIWGGGFVASDMALDSLSPFQIMTIRLDFLRLRCNPHAPVPVPLLALPEAAYG